MIGSRISPLVGLSLADLLGGSRAGGFQPGATGIGMTAPADSQLPEMPSSDGAMPKKKRGFFAKAGDFLGSDAGKATLFRIGASMLGGNSIGDSLLAGASYNDQLKQQQSAQDRWLAELAMKSQGLDIDKFNALSNDNYRRGSLDNDATRAGIDAARAVEMGRHNTATEGLTASGQRVQLRGQDIDRQNTIDRIGLGYAEEAGRDARHNRPDASTVYSTQGANWRHVTPGPAGIGSKGMGGTEVEERIPGTSGGWFGTPVPARKVTTRYPAPSSQDVMSLRQHPEQAQMFDQFYGPGAAQRILGVR